MSSNPYLDLVDTVPDIQGAMAVAVDKNPDDHAKKISLAQKFGVRSDFVEQNYDDFRKQQEKIDVDKNLATAGNNLKSFMSDPDNAAVSKDDLDVLKKIEEKASPDLWERSRNAIVYGSLNAAKGVVDFARMNEDINRTQNQEMAQNLGVKYTGRGLYRPGQLKQMSDYLAQTSEKYKSEEMQTSIITAAKNGDFSGATEALYLQVLNSVPQLALIAANPQAGMMALFASETGSKYQENIKSGVAQDKAVLNAKISGGISMAIESVGGVGQADVFKQLVKNLSKEVGQESTKQIVKQAAKQIFKTSGAEGAEEFVTSISQDLVDYGMDVNPDALKGILLRASDSFLVGAGSGGIVGVPMSISDSMKIYTDKNKAAIAIETYDTLGEAAKESKLRARSKEKFQEYMQSSVKGTALESVYVNPSDLKEFFEKKNLNPQEEIAKLGLLESFEKSVETGTDMKIDHAEWLSKTVDSEVYAGMKNYVKYDPNDLSKSEQDQQEKDVKDQLKEQDELAKADKTPDEIKLYEDSAKMVEDAVKDQLKNSGYSPKAAGFQARMYGEFFRTQGMKSNQMPLDLFNKYGLQIQNIEQDVAIGLGGTEYLTQGESVDTTEYFQASQQSKKLGIKFSATKVNNKLSVSPLDTVSASAEIVDSEAGKTAVVSELRTDKKYPGVSMDAIKSLEYAAARNGATSMSISANRLGLKVSDKIIQQYSDAGFTPSVSNGDAVFVKRLDPVTTYNQGSNKNFLKENSDRLKKNGFRFDVAEDPYFDDSGNEIEGPRLGEPDSTFTIYAEDKTGNQIGEAHFIINKYGELVPNDNDGGREAVTVDASFRRQGIATEMYRMASETVGKPVENMNGQSSDGKKFRDYLNDIDSNTFFQENRGSITFGANRQFNINLFKSKDETTFLHESAHFFLEVMGDIANTEKASDQAKADYQSLLGWFGVKSREEITTDHHEKFARGFEAYLYEGKAPSDRLKKAFRNFRQWLISIYKSVAPEQISDEVRGIYDRMFTADQMTEIDQMFMEPRAVLNEKETADYLEMSDMAKLEARDRLQAELMQDLIRKKDRAYKQKYDEIYKTEMEKAQAMPEFNVITAIQGDLKLSTPLIDKNYSKYKPFLPFRSTQKEGGQNPDVVASIFGYNSGIEMLDAIAPYRRGIEDYVSSQVVTQMKAEFPELLESPELSDAAIAAAHNQYAKKLKRMEMEYLFKNAQGVLKTVGGKLIKRMPTDMQVRKQAVKIISDTKVSEIKPYLYRAAEKRYAKTAAQEFKKGNFQEAFDAKQKEYLNFELYDAAVEAKQDVDKSVKNFKKLFKADEDVSKSRDVDLVNAARAILAKFGIVKAEKTAEQYLSKMKEYDPESFSVVSALVESATENSGQYNSVNYESFVEMRDAVFAIWDLAKNRKEIELDGKRVSMESVIQELNDHMVKLTPAETEKYKKTVDKWGMAKEKLLGAKASLVRAEHWTYAMGGKFTQNIFRPVSDAITKYRLEKENVLKKYESILKDYAKNVTYDVIVAEEIGFQFKDKAELMMAVLHTGNESNKRKLLIGRQWGSANEDGTLNAGQWDKFINRMQTEGILTKADYDFAQQVWDLLESLKPAAQKSHKQMYGYYFNEITSTPFETPFGEYRGGYVPAKTDVYAVEDSAIRKEREEFESNNNSFQFPTTGRGFTKSRVDAYAAPLSLDINMLGNHIDGVLRFSYIEPRVKEVAKLVTDKEFRAQLSKIDTNIAKDMLVPWLQRSAQQKVVLPSQDGLGKVLDSVASVLRRNVAIQIMFANVTNTLQQFTGLVVSMSKVKPSYIRNSLVNYIANNKQMTANIVEKSDWMKSTMGSNIYDIHNSINDIILNPNTYEKFKNFSNKHTYFLQSAAQNMVNTIVWAGAYDQAIANGNTDYEAIKEADSVVRTTQGTNNPEDISRYETGTKTELLFKQFVGYFNMLANLQASELVKISREVGLKKGAGKAVYAYMTVFMIPAILSDVLVRAMAGKFDDDDDDEYLDDALTSFFGSQFKTVAATIPYGGQAAVAAYNKLMTKNVADDRLSLSPAISILENAISTPISVYQAISDRGDMSKKNVKDVLQFVGIMTGLPTGPVGKPIGYLMDVESGQANPTGPIDFTRGIITGKPGGN